MTLKEETAYRLLDIIRRRFDGEAYVVKMDREMWAVNELFRSEGLPIVLDRKDEATDSLQDDMPWDNLPTEVGSLSFALQDLGKAASEYDAWEAFCEAIDLQLTALKFRVHIKSDALSVRGSFGWMGDMPEDPVGLREWLCRVRCFYIVLKQQDDHWEFGASLNELFSDHELTDICHELLAGQESRANAPTPAKKTDRIR